MNVRTRLRIEGAIVSALLALFCCVAAIPAGAQAPPAAARLEIAGKVEKALSLAAADLKAMPRTTVRVNGQVYEGVVLTELLNRAGVPQGGDVAGPWMAAHVLATAADGYRAAFSLAELTTGLGGTEVLVADTLDGAALGEGPGPFRLVVPSDKRAARWVRAVRSIRVVEAPN